MPGPARLYQFNPMSPIHHDEIFWSWVLDGTNKQKTGSNIVARSFCLPTRTRPIASSEHYGLGYVCLDPNSVRFRVNSWLWFSTCDRKQWCQARTIAQRRKAAFTLLARCFLLEGHPLMIWRSFWCSPWVCLCPRVYIMICSSELSGNMSASCPPICFQIKVGKMTHTFPSSEGEWYLYEE